jgi:quercetin dioxygenase-like cupin family protein/alkylhydroperoxidase/carboxymuconolactone decarboxylase family protein YurZ
MKRIVFFLTAIIIMTTTNGQTLSERQKGLAACACLMAQGNLERLEPAVRQALDDGVTINELKEAFSQLYAYTGFPRSLNALGVLSRVLEKRQANWQEGKPWTRPAEWDDARKTYELGTKNQTQLSGQPFDYTFCPQDDYYLKSHLFGDIFAGDGLTAADREIVTVAALSGLEGVAPQLAAHKKGAVNMGNSQMLIDELCEWLDKEGYTLRSKWPKGELNPYGQYFTGKSYLTDMGGGNFNVTFEPRCRNNWHIHHKQVQVLICVAGRGWYQEWGKEAQKMTPGTVITIPAEVKHWHGAAKDSWFQHLTYHKDVQEEAANELMEQGDARISADQRQKSGETQWCEPVTDEIYDKLDFAKDN